MVLWRNFSREVVAPQLVTDLDHWRYGMAHVEEPCTQPINPLDLFPRRQNRKYIALDAFELFANLVDDWKIVVTDKVEDRVHDRALAESQQLLVALATLPYVGIRRRCAVPDRDDKAFADDQVSLAILDFLAGQLARSQHDEQHIVIDIQLGALVRLIYVLDHQLVKAELGFEDAERDIIRLV